MELYLHFPICLHVVVVSQAQGHICVKRTVVKQPLLGHNCIWEAESPKITALLITWVSNPQPPCSTLTSIMRNAVTFVNYAFATKITQ
jgi:hypothetical protein